MVQRKVTNKLGILADEVKTNELLVNLKPSSFQHHDAKNKRADLKKKMKKSRPSKRSDIERLSSVSMRRQFPQPGKPPPPVVPKPVASPQKKFPVKSSEATPNYMKSTSSSDARKERLQVSSRNLQTLFDGKISSSEKAKISSTSVPKPARMLGRTSSLKLVRTLTKTTSFKPARASVKRCSPRVLSENLKAQRATCSSTLKDSKFPAYLALSSGGTESEGTSIMKVCPYAYCSLNGHHHSPLPPLRCFLSARRRMLKAQRVMKLERTSPRRSNTTGDLTKGGQVEQMKFDEPRPNQKALSGSMNSSVMEENPTDFFVQIYSKEREGTAEITDFFNHVRAMVEETPGHDLKATQLDNQQVLDILSEESPSFDVDSNENNNEISDAISTNMEDAEYNKEVNQNTEGEEEGHSLFPTQQKSSMESLSWSHDYVDGREIIPMDNTEFELSDMDWEADNYCVSLENTQDLDLQEVPIRFGSCIVPSKSIPKADGTLMRFFEEIQAGGLLQPSLEEEAFDEESVSSKGDTYQNFKIQEYIEGPDNKSIGQLWGSIVAEDGPVEECGETIINTNFIPTEKQTQETCSADSKTEEKCFQDDDAADEIWYLESQDFQDMTEQGSKEGWKDPTDRKDEVDSRHADVNSSISIFEPASVNGSISPKGGISDAKVEDEEKEQADIGNASTREEICPSLLDASEATKYSSRGLDDNHLEPFDLDGRSDETLAGEETRPISMSTFGTSREIDNLRSNAHQELAETCVKLKWRSGSNRFSEECKELKEFIPRGPNFLPLEPDPEAEKVDLKHQEIDERKNADEWMLDYAIQQAVTKLGPARKKKVALLVEAFETVMPIPRFKTQQRHASVAFPHARTIQACS